MRPRGAPPGAETVLLIVVATRYFSIDFNTSTPNTRVSVSLEAPALRDHTNERGRCCWIRFRSERLKTLLPVPDSLFTIECDSVIPAIGQSPFAQLYKIFGGSGARGTHCCRSETGQTGNPRYLRGIALTEVVVVMR
jgi:hypothetical protein